MTNRDLPWGWLRATRVAREDRSEQLELFPLSRDEALACARVSLDELERWRTKGWISFDAAALNALQEFMVEEVLFIRNLAQSGLSDAQVAQLLAELEPPYRYHPTCTAYSFAFGWVQIPPMPDESEVDAFIEEIMPKWIDEKATLGELEVLTDLDGEIRFAVAEARARRKNRGNE